MTPSNPASILVTGGTGLVGSHVVRALLAEQKRVCVLARYPEPVRALFGDAVSVARGDVSSPSTLRAALAGIDMVFHVAGLPEQWLADPSLFERVNVEGTRNMIAAALEARVSRFVYTSTCAVFKSAPGVRYDESALDESTKGTPYERSKKAADRLVVRAMQDRALPAVFVHPAAVYGPGPSKSVGLAAFVRDLRKAKVPLLPPGSLPLVSAADVGQGHVLAARLGTVGERFLFAEGTHTMREIATAALRSCPATRLPPTMPVGLARVLSPVGEWVARISGRAPLLPAGQLHLLLSDARPDSAHAKTRLGWTPVSLQQGMDVLIAGLGG